jgi:hypothetical protein
VPSIEYVPKSFPLTARLVINQARDICAQFARDGDDLTLRQLYYQFVAHDLFPDERTWRQVGSKWVKDPNGTKNAEPNYKWLGALINDARLAGMLDWGYIVDRTRATKGGTGSDTDPSEVIQYAADSYRVDKWAGQEFHVEAWIEKDALSGILQRACGPLEIPYFACRGYPSQSALWRAARRHEEAIEDGKKVRIIHLGDHDPSGIDMTRDIEHRLATFIAQDLDYCGSEEDAETCASEIFEVFQVERIALNMNQIRQYNPPPNPAKLSDSRGSGYVQRYGVSSWELDALSPTVLRELVTDAVLQYRDEDLWEERVSQEHDEKQILVALDKHWPDISEYVRETWPEELEADE